MGVNMNLQNIDLKLLVFLDALLDEKGVSRAAAKVCISQPAMSNALNKIRGLLDDPILVRSSQGMVPTHKALSIHQPLKKALAQLGETFAQLEGFDAKSAQRTFTISLTDYASSVLLPHLITLVKREAPQCRFRILDGNMDVEQLESAGVDIAINSFGALPGSYYEKKLWCDSYSVIASDQHSDINEPLTLEHYLKCEHILLLKSGVGAGPVDLALSEIQKGRVTAVETKHFHLTPRLVETSEMIATIPSKLACYFSHHYGLSVYTPPIELKDFQYSMVWSALAQHDPACVWLRSKVVQAVELI